MQIFKDYFILRKKKSHWKATCSTLTKQHRSETSDEFITDCDYNPKAANRNILLIVFVIDLLMDYEGQEKGMMVIL